ncbi:MAG: helix-turn-helix transcriptional regulator [Nocardioidaceae bacterium]|jgi:transcriptional regulator with XRE-family HTH domain|nr:helix-turn-helix transcriptional regulator [Nocardioidaceae bacterium]
MRDQLALRSVIGDVLRQRRMRQGQTLRQISAAARVSLGYISEIERGQKEASSEMLAALCTALQVPLSAVLRDVSDRLVIEETRLSRHSGDERRLALAVESIEQQVPLGTSDRHGDVVVAA